MYDITVTSSITNIPIQQPSKICCLIRICSTRLDPSRNANPKLAFFVAVEVSVPSLQQVIASLILQLEILLLMRLLVTHFIILSFKSKTMKIISEDVWHRQS